MAVKVIEHYKGTANTAEVRRESALSTSIAHPNVVSAPSTLPLFIITQAWHRGPAATACRSALTEHAQCHHQWPMDTKTSAAAVGAQMAACGMT